MNTDLTAKQLGLLRHALGLKADGNGASYRNYYCQGIDFESEDLRELRGLVTAGLMREGQKINEGRDQYFLVTEAGKTAATRDVKPLRLTRAQRRYRTWLKLDMGVSFKEFLTEPAWAEARRR